MLNNLNDHFNRLTFTQFMVIYSVVLLTGTAKMCSRYCSEIATSNPSDATVTHGHESKREKQVVHYWWEGWHILSLSVSVTLDNHGLDWDHAYGKVSIDFSSDYVMLPCDAA